MPRRLPVVCWSIVFAFTSVAAGCSSIANPTLTPRSIAVGSQTAPQSLGSWTTKAHMPTARYVFAVGVVSDRLFAVGGCNADGCGNPLNAVEAYNPVTNAWTAKADMPTARYDLTAAVVTGILYAIGGVNAPKCGTNGICNTVEAYNPAMNAWTARAPIPTARYDLAAGVVNGIVFAVGGQYLTTLNTNEAYDPLTDTWTTKAPMPTARYGLAVSVINGILYAVGGCCDSNGHALNTVEAYNPATDSWTTEPSMPTPRYLLATSVVRGRLVAIGGENSTGFSNAVESYNPATNTWTAKASMPTARVGLAAGVVKRTLYAIGGYNGGFLRKVEAFNP